MKARGVESFGSVARHQELQCGGNRGADVRA